MVKGILATIITAILALSVIIGTALPTLYKENNSGLSGIQLNILPAILRQY